MQRGKRCGRCNILNDPDRTYCVNCGKYLNGKVDVKKNRVTVWGRDERPEMDVENVGCSPRMNRKAGGYVVICPECLTENEALNGILPLACSACGYFFQAGIDKIVSLSDKPKENGKKKVDSGAKREESTPVNNAGGNDVGGPMRRAAKDSSALRLVSISSNTLLPEMMKETGNIIGQNGTAFQGIQTSQQITVWHSLTGWYARATAGTPLFNGVPMNQGIQVKLSAGDLLVLDQEQFMVEIL